MSQSIADRREAAPTAAFSPSQKVDRLAPYILLALTLLGGARRVLALDSKGLWLDEAFSIWLARQPLPDVYGWLLKIDQHPPLYYTLLHVWMAALGDSVGAVRLLSALFGVATIPVIFLLGRRLLGAPGGLIAAAILTVAPFHVRFAQETRMYTLLAFNAACALYFLARLLTDPRAGSEPLGAQIVRWFGARRAGTERRLPLSTAATDLSWLGLIIFTVATMLTHNTAILFTLSMNLFVFGFIAWQQRIDAPVPATAAYPAQLTPPSAHNWLAAQAGILLLWSIWLPGFVVQARGVDAEFWIQKPTLTTIATAVGNLFSAHLPIQSAFIIPAFAVFAGLSALGLYYLRRHPALPLLLLTLFAAPILGELLVSLRRPIFYDRTLIYVTLPVYLLMAAGVQQLGRAWRPAMWAALIAVAAISGVSLHQYYTNFEKEQWREAAAYLAEQAQAGDLLIFNATWVQIPFDYYFRDANAPPVEERGAPVDLFDRGLLEPKMTRADAPRLRELIQERERVWLIYSHNWYTDPESIVPDVLGADLKLLEERPFVGLDVRLYGDAAP